MAKNNGKRWTADLEAALLAAVARGVDHGGLAADLERSPGAVRGRLLGMAVRMVSAGTTTVREAAALTGTSPEDVQMEVDNPRATVTPTPRRPAQPAAPSSRPAPTWPPTAEQQAVLDTVALGRDVFLTGPAGTGKSYTIGLVLDWARSAGKKVALTATTGAAGALINGSTLYSYLGIGLGTREVADLVAGANRHTVERVRAMDIMVIDEVSMLSAELMDKVVAYTLAVRRGVQFQLVLSGDFCQLPPVQGAFCFEAAAWAQRSPVIVQLTQLMRQSGDSAFQEMLMRLRWGECGPEDEATLRALGDTAFDGGLRPTRLHSLNAEVDRINREEFAALVALGGATRSYPRVTRDDRSRAWADAAGVPSTVVLCLGAQVMVTRNIPDLGLVNGSRGEVAWLPEDGDSVVLRRPGGGLIAVQRVALNCENDAALSVRAMPVRLAYCLSIHKSQGITLDAMEVNLGRSVFEYGQAYVAISRAKSLSSVRVLDVHPASFRTHPSVVAFYKK